MAYDHADHAGNFADVLKHAILAYCAEYLTRKDKPFAAIDTHAGAAVHPLGTAEDAAWRAGAGLVWRADAPAEAKALLAPWRAVLETNNPDGVLARYPGSPAFLAELTRPQDRLALWEADAEAAKILAAALGRDGRISVTAGDGYAGLKTALPPPERRGLVLVDPAHDDPDEMAAMAAAAKDALGRWPTGTFIFWRPLKDLWAVERFDVGLAEWLIADRDLDPEKILRADLWVRELETQGPSAGAGVVVVNPPFGLEEGLLAALPWFAERLAQGPGAGWRLDGAITEDSLTVDEF